MFTPEDDMADLFATVLSPETMQKLDNVPFSPLAETTIDFLLVKICATAPQDFQNVIGIVIETALEQAAVIESVLSSLVLITFGSTVSTPAPIDKRLQLVEALLQAQGEHIAIIHGHQTAFVGTLGPAGASYGSLIPGITGYLKALDGLEYGMVREIDDYHHESEA